MIRTVRRTVRRHRMFSEDDRVLCCLSGGADSVALLLCLREMGVQVCACHLNHHLRGEESERDERFCRALCERLDIPLLCETADIRTRPHVSLETAAREVRYEFFRRAARELNASRIATAHTADDNLETMIFHLARGSGAAGLSGIPPVRGDIVRPLIECERSQIEAYLNETGQDWCTDCTNRTDDYARNRIRHAVVPVLRELCPAAAVNAAHAAQLLRQDQEYLDAQAAQLPLDCETLRDAPSVLRTRRLRMLMQESGVPMGEVGGRQMQAAERLVRNGRGQFSLAGGFVLCCRNGAAEIVRAAARPAPCALRVGQTVEFGEFRLNVHKMDEPARKVFNNSFNKFSLSYDTIDVETLGVRIWNAADRMRLPGARGARSLKRLYAERGIAPEQRDGYPVICDRFGVIAAYALGCDERRLAGAPVLEIQIQKR
ncbi:MAG: tRNA lysidine(34) synthetase TilS [Butyricicoccaceae bacterium]